MPETAPILEWTLVLKVPTPQDIHSVLLSGEVPVASYKTFRDSATFTNKRLISDARRSASAGKTR